jgi:transposase
MDEINKIRKAYFTNGETKHEIAKKFNRSWNTIDRIVETDRELLEEQGKRPGRKASVATEAIKDEIRKLLKEEECLKVKKKQRYTAAFLYKDLKRRGLFKGSERTMRIIVRDVRQELNVSKPKSYLPLSFEIGCFVQIDHGKADCRIAGERIRGYLFVAGLPGICLRYCRLYPVKAQEAWGNFHEHAFRFFDGVFGQVIYDNDSVLVKNVLGSEHYQTDFSHALEEHYGFQSRFCNVGAGNEKGAVENAVGFCRRNYLPGLPSFSNWTEANDFLEKRCREDIAAGTHYRTAEPLNDIFVRAQTKLLPLLPERNWVKWEQRDVNSQQLITHDEHRYSVPERYVGSTLRVGIGVFTLVLCQGHEVVAEHCRQYTKGADSLLLEHYLPQLKRKPGALWNCAAVKAHAFEPELQQLWERLSSRFDTREANAEFIKTLLLRRQYGTENLLTAIGLALSYGSVEHAAILNVLQQLNSDSTPSYDSNWLSRKYPELADKSFAADYDLSCYANLHEGGR